MAYSVATFTASQTIGLPSIVNLTDAHVGTDVLVTQRRAFLQTASGSYLVPAGTTTSYVQWNIANASISINALIGQDYAPSIKVQWLDVTDVVLYEKIIPFSFTLYGEQKSFDLTKALSYKPQTLQDQNYWLNRIILRGNIDDSNNAITFGSDTYTAQAALDREAYMLANEDKFF